MKESYSDFSIIKLIEGVDMRRIITIVVVVTLIATLGILNGEAQEGQKFYTAYNIWKTSKMMCINFKQGYETIPAGTVVKDVHIWQTGNKSYIRFKTVKDGREYTIGFFEKWHPKKKIKDYRDKMFTIKNIKFSNPAHKVLILLWIRR